MANRVPFTTLTGERLYPGDFVVYVGSSYRINSKVRLGIYTGTNGEYPAVIGIHHGYRSGHYFHHATLFRKMVFKSHNPMREAIKNVLKFDDERTENLVKDVERRSKEYRAEYEKFLTLAKELVRLEVKELS